MSRATLPSYAYIDLNYVRAELRKSGQAEFFSPYYLQKHLSANTLHGQSISPDHYFVYDAVDENAPQAEQDFFQAYLAKIEDLPFTTVATGFVRAGKGRRRQQKAVDVQIAVDALEATWSGRTKAIMLVAGDADFCPLAEAVRRAGAFFLVFGYRHSLATELKRSADFVNYLPDPIEGHLKPF